MVTVFFTILFWRNLFTRNVLDRKWMARSYNSYLMLANWRNSFVLQFAYSAVLTGFSSIGEWTLICLKCVSLPCWWLAITAIWIINDLTKRSFKSFRGITTHPEGSFSSTTSISCKSLKFVPHLLWKCCYRKFSTPTQGCKNTYN